MLFNIYISYNDQIINKTNNLTFDEAFKKIYISYNDQIINIHFSYSRNGPTSFTFHIMIRL